MKIVCDSCSTKYSISDDKVRGKVFKIRCKKCSHIIVVRGTTEAPVEAPQAAPDAVWHLVVEGDQVGPLTEADLRGRLSRAEITPENYVWKEGFADWLRLAEVPEFADVESPTTVGELGAQLGGELFSDASAARENAPAAVGGASVDLGGFFAGGGIAQSAAGAAAAAPSSSGRGHAQAQAPVAAPEEDVFSAPASSSASVDGGDLFGSAVPMLAHGESGKVRARGSNGASGRHDGGRVESLTAQRSENSVLFSLSNLQSLAAPAAPKTGVNPATEGSGLIDIRAMAASTLRAPGGSGSPLFGGDARRAEDDLPAFGSFSSAAPVLLGIPSSSGPPKWFYVIVALIAVLIVVVGIAAFSILNKPVMVEQQVLPPPPPAMPSGPAKPGEQKAGDQKAGEQKAGVSTSPSKPLAEGELPPREAAGAGTPSVEKSIADRPAANKVLPKRAKGKRAVGGESKSAGSAVAAAPGSSAAEPDKAKPAKGSLDDLLEGALNGRKGRPKVDDDGPSSKKAPEATAGGGPLTKGAVVAGMNGVKGKVSACYAQYKVPGLVMVTVVIGKSGKVSTSTVTGKFAGTPTGSCVENAVKTASFPPSDGLTTPYPFTLR